MLARILRYFSAPGGPRRLAVLALVMSLPALAFGFQADDHIYAAARAEGVPAWKLFELTGARMAEQRELGVFSWWSSPRLAVHFFRPLASFTHWLEFGAFPELPAAMKLTNVLLYAAIVGLAALAYRKLAPSLSIAALAGLMFTLDDAHGNSVGWISARNTLLAMLFSLCAFLAYLASRENRSLRLQAACAASVALALLSAEAGVWALALLTAHALTLDDAPLAERAVALAPAFGVAAIWAAFYVTSGPRGVPGSEWYRDLADPAHAAAQGILDLPIWLATLFGPSLGSVTLPLPSAIGRLIAVPFAALSLAWLVLALPQTRACRFFAVATALCLVPALFTVPQERVALGASFGGFGWMACYAGSSVSEGSAWRRFGRGLILFTHVFFAFFLFPTSLGVMQPVEHGTREFVRAISGARDAVIVSAPMEVLNNYALNLLSLPQHLARRPASSKVLYTGASDLVLQRPDAQTLDVHAVTGWGRSPLDRTFCALRELPRRGEHRSFRAFTATVLDSTADGRPVRVRFVFPTALEDPARAWFTWRDRALARFEPPRIGGEVRLEGRSFFRSLHFSP